MEISVVLLIVALLWWTLSSRQRREREQHKEREERSRRELEWAAELEAKLRESNRQLAQAKERATFDEHGFRRVRLTKRQLLTLPEDELTADEHADRMVLEEHPDWELEDLTEYWREIEERNSPK